MSKAVSRLVDQKSVLIYMCCFCRTFNLIVNIDDYDAIRCWKCGLTSLAGDGFGGNTEIDDDDFCSMIVKQGEEIKNNFGSIDA